MQKHVSYLDSVIHKVLVLIKAGIVLSLSAGYCATSIDIPCNISLHIVFVSVRHLFSSLTLSHVEAKCFHVSGLKLSSIVLQTLSLGSPSVLTEPSVISALLLDLCKRVELKG